MDDFNFRVKGIPESDSSELLRVHLTDLKNANKNELPPFIEKIPLIIPSKNIIFYVKNVVKNAVLSVLFDWTSPIAHPLNVILYLFIYVPLLFVLYPFEIILRFVEWNGWTRLEGTVLEHWKQLSDEVDNLRKGFESLDKSIPLKEERKSSKFDVDRAEALLYLSTLMYKRDENAVLMAKRKLNQIKTARRDPSSETIDLAEVSQLLLEADQEISEEAEAFELRFKSISEMRQFGGPYAGIFWSDQHNFIVAAFKGTTPTNFTEWLLDATIQRMDGRAYLFGEVHKGFYTSLFPNDEFSSAEADRESASFFLIEAIKKQAKIMSEKNNDNGVHIWVTGHSLGAAYTTLFYSHLLKIKEGFGDQCLLRDAYAFASPLVGDSNFAAEFFSLYNTDHNLGKNLWRIVNDNDIIPRLPPHNLALFRPYADNIYTTNYVHIGDEIIFYQDGIREPKSHSKICGETYHEQFIRGDFDNNGGILFNDRFFNKFNNHHRRKMESSMHNRKLDGYLYGRIEHLAPNFARNHIDYRYFVVLEKSRKFFQ
nr:15673_t:CDS:2 [Entrophospora candida]